MIDMRRREFIALLGGAAVWPVAARAQQPAMPVVGYLNIASASQAYLLATFLQGLNAEGYAEGRNVALEYRFANNQPDRLPALAADLVDRGVAVLAATGGTVSALAAKAATTAIPVVFTTGDDPVRAGLVASLNRPGGNLTGVSVFAARLGAKRLGLLRELLPAGASFGFLVNPWNPDTEDEANDVWEAARALGVDIILVRAGTEVDFDAAFATLVQQRAAALIVASDTYFDAQRDRICALAARNLLPSMHSSRFAAEAGAVICYGTSIPDVYRQAGGYVGRILKGAKPADLPILLPTRFELIH